MYKWEKHKTLKWYFTTEEKKWEDAFEVSFFLVFCWGITSSIIILSGNLDYFLMGVSNEINERIGISLPGWIWVSLVFIKSCVIPALHLRGYPKQTWQAFNLACAITAIFLALLLLTGRWFEMTAYNPLG